MKHRIPRRPELVVLIIVSIACAVIVRVTGKYDEGLAILGGPLFLVSALMGLRRSTLAQAAMPVPPLPDPTAPSDGSAE